MKDEQEPHKIWASHPLHKIELHTTYINLKIIKTHLKIFKWKFSDLFIDSHYRVLRPIYRRQNNTYDHLDPISPKWTQTWLN